MKSSHQIKPEKQLNLIQQREEMFAKIINERPFPVDGISSLWFTRAWTALELGSPFSMNVSHADFVKLVKKFDTGNWKWQELTLVEFAILSNNMDTRSARDLGLDYDGYCELLEESTALIKKHAELIQVVRDEVDAVLAKKGLEEKMATGNPLRPDTMKMIKGEA